MFACHHTVMWVEKNFLDHHYIECFQDKHSDASEKSISLLKDYFDITNQEDFMRQLYLFQDDTCTEPLRDFIENAQALIKAYEGNEQSIAEGIIASYQQASYITQFYNFKRAIVPLEGGSTLCVGLYGASTALFILCLGISIILF